MSTEPTSDEPDFYDQTRFWASARRYGFGPLLLTFGWGFAVLGAVGVLFLYLHGCLDDDGLKALGVAYISLGAALFGIVLAGLAVVAAFFDPAYVKELHAAGSLHRTLFVFWWVAAVAVLALLASVVLTVAVNVGASEPVVAVAAAAATTLFLAAVLESLSLVGTMMRHGLYRAEIIVRDLNEQDSDEP